MTKYKYYFKKPKSEIVKDILRWLVISGAVYIAATSPYFILNLMKAFKYSKKYTKKRVYDTFYQLEREGCIQINKKSNQIYISLTKKGKKRAGWLQIDALKIKGPRKWDGKWRVVIFDIVEMKKFHREALRGKLKELGFHLIQKSVWIHPFDCRDEISLLRDFFGLTEDDLRLLIVENIGEDRKFKSLFNLS